METKAQKGGLGRGVPRASGPEAFSPICTHLGCGHRWDDVEKKFLCPCHGSVFDVNGIVLGGPALRPLDVLPSKVEGGRLLVMYKDLNQGSRKVSSCER
ncbi:MAG: ubiquinol-cytochrome c reductase iron-sulfur subunit [Nitrospira sp.]|nr:ubiquinol-cytochrome c reductase iron-sulfur subunit [Nitrospira sp.]